MLFRRGVTHRLDIQNHRGGIVYDFQGLLDRAALETLRAAVDVARASGAPVRIVLRAGTEVERACVADLAAIDAEIVADSPYLARWISGARVR